MFLSFRVNIFVPFWQIIFLHQCYCCVILSKMWTAFHLCKLLTTSENLQISVLWASLII